MTLSTVSLSQNTALEVNVIKSTKETSAMLGGTLMYILVGEKNRKSCVFKSLQSRNQKAAQPFEQQMFKPRIPPESTASQAKGSNESQTPPSSEQQKETEYLPNTIKIKQTAYPLSLHTHQLDDNPEFSGRVRHSSTTSPLEIHPQLRRTLLNIPLGPHLPPPLLLVPLIHLSPDPVQALRVAPPHLLLVSQPQPQHMSLVVFSFIHEAASSMQHGKVVKDLHVPLLQLDRERVFLGQEVHHVERLGLDLAHGRDQGVVRREVRACERAAGELEAWAMFMFLPSSIDAGKVIEKRPRVILVLVKLVKRPIVPSQNMDHVRPQARNLVVDSGR